MPNNNPNWLNQIPNYTLLRDINIPGTHNSAAITAVPNGTPYACHGTTITQQLTSGVRLLDVRLKIKKDLAIVTCHGSIGLGSINEYKSLDFLMTEVEVFLQANSSEFVIISLKIDDWAWGTRTYEEGYNALITFFSNRNRVDMTNFRADMTLGEVRGSILTLNRLLDTKYLDKITSIATRATITEKLVATFGFPLTWTHNTDGEIRAFDSQGTNIFVQDKFQNFGGDDENLKFDLVRNAMEQKTDANIVLNYASSCTKFLKGVCIGDRIIDYIGRRNTIDPFGWILFDYEHKVYEVDEILDDGTMDFSMFQASIVDLIVDSNQAVDNRVYPVNYYILSLYFY